MAGAIQTYATPWLANLSADADALLEAIYATPAFDEATGLTRAVVVLARSDRTEDALGLLTEREERLNRRTDAAAEDDRRVIGVLRKSLSPSL